MTPEEVVAEGRRLLAAGEPFAAHEVFEDEWKAVKGSARQEEREFWRGLAQAAVAAEHAKRGNEVGHQRLRERAALTLDGQPSRYGVDVAELRAALTSGAPINLEDRRND